MKKPNVCDLETAIKAGDELIAFLARQLSSAELSGDKWRAEMLKEAIDKYEKAVRGGN